MMNSQGGSITNLTLELITRTTGWMKFLAVMGFIGSGFLVLGSFAVMSQPYTGPYLFLGYLIVGVIGFFPALYLLQYANLLSDFVQNRDAGALEMAFEKQRSMYVFIGIITIIYIALIIILFLIGIAAATRMF